MWELHHGSGPWERPNRLDIVFTAAVAALAVTGLFVDDLGPGDTDGPVSAVVVLTLLTVAPLLWRRAHSLRVLLAVTAGVILLSVTDQVGTGAGVAQIIAMFGVAVGRTRAPAVAALAVAQTGTVVWISLGAPRATPLTVVANALALFAVWAFARSIGFRRAYTAELEARAERLERTREADTRAAIAEERGRIARELHDVVAHHVSVMTVQATAAQRTLARDPERAREAMSAVEQTGRAALVEMRRLVGILRGHETDTADGRPDEGHNAPQPGLDEIDALVTQVREAGLPVELAIEGRPRPLAPGVDLAAYRIVQEALTNTLKHAGPAASRVLIGYGPGELLVRVADDGAGAAAPEAPERTGHGLLGMRERVSLYGGHLDAGPGPGGGFEVVARIPFTDAGGDRPGRP
jgi:signal transduction histidine kinase